MIDCGVFLDRHSDYRDGRLDTAAHVAMKQHMAECDDCRRHDEAIRRGVDILRRAQIDPPDQPLDMDALRKRALKSRPRDDDGPGFPGGDLVAALLVAAPIAPVWMPG